jgi:hypothetical protein
VAQARGGAHVLQELRLFHGREGREIC